MILPNIFFNIKTTASEKIFNTEIFRVIINFRIILSKQNLEKSSMVKRQGVWSL